ncbi:hypothetical protein H4R21_006718, partial [Coemansia helicoidea]
HRREGAACWQRASRHDLAAVHWRSRQLGRHWRSHDRVAGPPRAGVGHVGADRVQERHRWQRQDRCGRDQVVRVAALLPVGNQAGAERDRRDAGQPALPCHSARRRRRPQLRGEARQRVRRAAGQGGRQPAPDGGLQPRQQLQGLQAAAHRCGQRRPAAQQRRVGQVHRRRHDREQPRRGQPELPRRRRPVQARLRQERDRRVRQLDRHGCHAGRPARGRAQPPQEGTAL